MIARFSIDTYDMRVAVKLPQGTERTGGRRVGGLEGMGSAHSHAVQKLKQCLAVLHSLCTHSTPHTLLLVVVAAMGSALRSNRWDMGVASLGRT